jgi:hypothetical protein
MGYIPTPPSLGKVQPPVPQPRLLPGALANAVAPILNAANVNLFKKFFYKTED